MDYSFPRSDYSRSRYGRRRRDDVDSLFRGGYDEFDRSRRDNRRVYTRIRYDPGYPRLCEVCHTSLANAQQWESHCAGKKHVKNLKKLSGEHQWNNGIPPPAELTEEMMEADNEYIEVNPTTSIRMCTLCYVDFTSDVMEESHRTGKRHLKNVKYAKQGLLNGQADSTLGKCEICDVVFTSPTQKLSHLNGRRHEEECWSRGIPLERPNKRSNSRTEEPPASKRVKTETDKGKDLSKKARGNQPVKKEPTRKEISSQNTSTTRKRAGKKNENMRKTNEANEDCNSKVNSPTKLKKNSSANSFECKNKPVTESVKGHPVNSKPGAQQTSTKAKETPEPVSQETGETVEEVPVSEEIAPEEAHPSEEQPLLPHQLIEKEADEMYEKYTQTAEDNPEKAQELYDEYREIYKRYEVAYQEYLDTLNLDDMS